MSDTTVQIFTYGTLSFDEVMKIVAGTTYRTEPATLEDHARYQVKGQLFPGVCREPGTSVSGVLHYGVGAEAVEKIDFFEDSFYQRELLLVETREKERIEAYAYIVPPGELHVLSEKPWDEESFSQNELLRYLERARNWMSEFTET